MEPAHHYDPLAEALSHGSQRVAQVASLAAAMAQVVMQHRALNDAKTAMLDGHGGIQVLNEQERLLHQQARIGWAPAHDVHWLPHAGLPDTARTWAAAAAYADTDPTASSAMRKCEDRLRTLHPYAMARYDRLRNDGLSPLDAMRQAAPLFGREPATRTGDPARERHALPPGTAQEPSAAAQKPPSATVDLEPDAHAEARGQQIIDRLQSHARAAGRSALGPLELAMVLEAATNLPPEVIDRLTKQPGSHTRTPIEQDRSAAQLAAQSFPHSPAEALNLPRTRTATHADPPPAQIRRPQQTRQPDRSP